MIRLCNMGITASMKREPFTPIKVYQPAITQKSLLVTELQLDMLTLLALLAP